MPDAPDHGEQDGPAADQIYEDEQLPPHVPARHPLLTLLHDDVGHVGQNLAQDNSEQCGGRIQTTFVQIQIWLRIRILNKKMIILYNKFFLLSSTFFIRICFVKIQIVLFNSQFFVS